MIRQIKRIASAFLGCALLLAAAAPVGADQAEDQIGAQVYQQLSKKGEILSSSPYYSVLNPIASKIKSAADRQYDRPFRFLLVHESQPNAFSVPGGNVYVTDALMKFVKNKEELAGVLCHETSHTIHHDVVNNMRKDQNVGLIATGLSILLGGKPITNAALGIAANMQTLTFSRSVETAADLKGADTCAEAGFNPWGMVWLFQQFQKSGTGGSMEMLSDHPNDSHRVADLEGHFRSQPEVFGTFSSDIANATPLLARDSKTAQGPPGQR